MFIWIKRGGGGSPQGCYFEEIALFCKKALFMLIFVYFASPEYPAPLVRG